MNLNLDNINQILQFITGAASVGGFLYGGWKMIVQPISRISKKIEKVETRIEKFENTVESINKEVLPVIQSLDKEFTKNSGKSIMDRILRIDDNTRLAELRSKLIASNLMTTSMLEFDKYGSLIWANKAFINLTGLDLEQLKSNGWFVCINEEERTRVWNLWTHSIKSNMPFESEFLIKNQTTDDERSVKCIVFPHKSIDTTIDNPILGYYGTIIEIVN